jgi:hypothetical protein
MRRVQGAGCRGQGAGCRVQGAGCRGQVGRVGRVGRVGQVGKLYPHYAPRTTHFLSPVTCPLYPFLFAAMLVG